MVLATWKDDGTYPEQDNNRSSLANKLWSWSIEKNEFEPEAKSGLGSQTPGSANVAYDADNHIGWIYGGVDVDMGANINATGVHSDSEGPETPLKSMIRYDIPGVRLVQDRTSSNPIGNVKAGSMTFLPDYGEEGILILFGGVSDNATRNMNEINVYDIKTKTWYTQQATAEGGNYPESRQHFCSVTASAADRTSHNIFIYGGSADGVKNSYKDVWVLSIPAFHWIYIGDAIEGKSRLTCHLLQERYMVTYRGRQIVEDVSYVPCDMDRGGLRMFDLQILGWTNKYVVPSEKPVYQVPKKIYSIIGGNANGGANETVPRRGWSADGIELLFNKNTPLEPGTSTTSSPNPTSTNHSSDDSGPSTPVGAIVGGVIGGLGAIALILLAITWLRRSKPKRDPAIALQQQQDQQAARSPLVGQQMGTEYQHQGWYAQTQPVYGYKPPDQGPYYYPQVQQQSPSELAVDRPPAELPPAGNMYGVYGGHR
ncbi:hypothetical protein BDZ91DRAFT_178669 [Kalaharituber pfeilii]|nr:hypothetical protein BDZ91DRAFT_178669 [Kalaharituber pfeilii]